LVVLLAGAVNLQSGGRRLGNLAGHLRYEARDDFASILDDVNEIRARVETLQYKFKELSDDAGEEFRILMADVTLDARLAAKRISALIKST
jgi:hypothetical protein